ncbi:MAG: Lin0512 family protein [Pseudomonadota bacterium]
MTEQRIIMELGAGVDLHGRDYTKAAKRAVEDAMRHSSLSIIRQLGLDHATMRVVVAIGVAEPDQVDKDAVAAVLPYGKKEVTVVKGGVTADGMGGPGDTVIAAAGVTAFIDIPDGAFTLSNGS